MKAIPIEHKAKPPREIIVRRIPCEVYSRIVGYLRPTSAWNAAKQVEFADRITFRVPDIVLLDRRSTDADGQE